MSTTNGNAPLAVVKEPHAAGPVVPDAATVPDEPEAVTVPEEPEAVTVPEEAPVVTVVPDEMPEVVPVPLVAVPDAAKVPEEPVVGACVPLGAVVPELVPVLAIVPDTAGDDPVLEGEPELEPLVTTWVPLLDAQPS